MKDSLKMISITVALLVIVSLTVIIYESVSNTYAGHVPAKTSSTVGAGPTVYLRMGGATFPAPQYLAWIKEFMKEHPRIKVSYELLGSGAGVSRFLDGTLDIAGSDPPLPHSVWVKHEDKLMQVPTLVGAVVVTYNIPGLNSVTLNLSGRVLALIYKGVIKYWDDPRIQALNPGIKLPHHEIFVVFRADASGTQQVFTTFLHKAAPDVWPSTLVGKAPAFPVAGSGRAAGGKGNPGVANLIKSNPYSIGFVEWSYALENNLSVAALENAAGEFVKPTPRSLLNAAKAAAANLPKSPLGDFSSDENYIIYSSGKHAYPLVAWTHLIIRTHYGDPAKARAVATFLKWVAEKGESKTIPGYVPVPDTVKQLILKAAEEVLSNSGG